MEPRANDLELRGTARKCSGGNFSVPGKMYIASDGNIIAGPEPYGTNQSSESITFTPLKLNSAGRHAYQAYFQSDNNNPGDYIISGSVDAWEEYHSYLSGSWQAPADVYEYSFLFDPVALGLTGWHKYQVHVFPSGQEYPIRSGIISARDIPASQPDQYEPDNDFTQAKSINTDGSVQTHSIHVPGDEDWMKFEAQRGYHYVIETLNLQGGADTLLGLFWDNLNDNHPDLIRRDDNGGDGQGSHIEWTAPRTGTHYVKIRDVNPSTGNAGVAYQVRVIAEQTAAYDTPFLTDDRLENYSSMTESQIRQFLVENHNYFRQPVEDSDGQIFDMAQVVLQAATQYRINPRVLLVTLEKENRGVTQETRPSNSQMRFLMGCISPSTARQQILCAAERFRSYHDNLNSTGQTVSGWKVDTPKSTADGVLVTPATKAVAGQFTYTPYAGAQWGGNQSRWGGVYLFYSIWHQFGFDGTETVDTARPIAQITAPTNGSTVTVR